MVTDKVQKTAILGGSFDPVHRAHLALARSALEAGMDQVLWVPAARPPHKTEKQVSDGAHRMAMLRLRLEDEPGMAIDDRELHREGLSYSVLTARELHEERPRDELHFIVGMDSLELLPTWYRIEELAHLVVFLVASRPGWSEELLESAREACPALRLKTFEAPVLLISSSEIRSAAAAGLSVREWTGDAVADYIEEQGLYRDR